MLDGILSPAFLQAAGAHGKLFSGIKLRSTLTTIVDMYIGGTFDVIYKKNGITITEHYEEFDGDLYIFNDLGSQVVIRGEIDNFGIEDRESLISSVQVINTALTTLDCYSCPGLTSLDLSANTALTTLYCSSCPGLTSLDLSANTALTTLNCYSCPGLTSLDLSANTALTTLYCYSCPGLTSISYPATNSDVSTVIASTITAATAADGTVYTDSDGDCYSTIADAATAKGWTIEQIPA